MTRTGLALSNHGSELGEHLADILAPPPKRSLADEVLERLRGAILRSQLAGGQQLREQELAQTMSVSRGPVREALSQLEREGLVIRRRNRIAQVAWLSREDLEEIYSLRNAIERLAMKYACRNATASDMENMQAVVNTMASRMEHGISEQEAADLDLRFHDILYQASRHERLIALWSRLRPQCYLLLLNRNAANPDFIQTTPGGHQDILDVLRDRDVARAVAVIEHHVRFAYETVLASHHSEPTRERADWPSMGAERTQGPRLRNQQ